MLTVSGWVLRFTQNFRPGCLLFSNSCFKNSDSKFHRNNLNPANSGSGLPKKKIWSNQQEHCIFIQKEGKPNCTRVACFDYGGNMPKPPEK
jgi:hypothetical protein